MSDSHYSAIEARTGFRVPESFCQLVAAGLTQYGATREEWKRTCKQRMLENPPALMLVSSEVEWWSPESIAGWEAPDHWSEEHRFVPFAQNGAGDLWCWHVSSPDASAKANVRVLAPHLPTAQRGSRCSSSCASDRWWRTRAGAVCAFFRATRPPRSSCASSPIPRSARSSSTC